MPTTDNAPLTAPVWNFGKQSVVTPKPIAAEPITDPVARQAICNAVNTALREKFAGKPVQSPKPKKKPTKVDNSRPVVNAARPVLNIGSSKLVNDESPLTLPAMNYDSGENDVDIMPDGRMVKKRNLSDEDNRDGSNPQEQGIPGFGPEDGESPLLLPNSFSSRFPSQTW